MSKSYFRAPEMFGDKEFKCPNCNKLMIRHIIGVYELRLECPRCKAEIAVKTKEPIPIAVQAQTQESKA